MTHWFDERQDIIATGGASTNAVIIDRLLEQILSILGGHPKKGLTFILVEQFFCRIF